jgi:putative transcriptional regulator
MGEMIEARAKGEAARRQGSSRGRPSPDSPGPLSPAGAKIVAAFEEAIEAMHSGEPLEGRFTVRTYRVDFTPRVYNPDDVRRVRGLLGMSQAVFARFLGVDANTVRSWEQGNRPPSPIARRFMDEIEADPEYWRRRNIDRATGVEMSGSTG